MKQVYFIGKRALLFSCLLLLTVLGFAQPIFINPIPIPPILDATNGPIHLEMRVLSHKFNPADPSDDASNGVGQSGIESWCYNQAGDSSMTYLGPVLKWRTGDSVNITVTNLLPDSTTTHWHGAELPAKFDGGPHQPIPPDSSWSINIIDLDSSSTMWYHPHFHNKTYPQVQLGLSGMIISEQEVDPIRDILPRTYGIDDMPVIIGDQRIVFNNTLGNYEIVTAKSRRPMNLVNGVSNPYLEVPAHLVRLRILNGSTRKGILMSVSQSYQDTVAANREDFVLVATDGGYTLKPDTMNKLLLGPGARSEIILDLRSYFPGDVIYLRNLKEIMPKSVIGSSLQPTNNPNAGPDTTLGNAFLQIRIVSDPPNYTPLDVFTPFTTSWSPEIADTTNIARQRTKKLLGSPGQGFTIDGLTYSMTNINDTVCVNTKEIWTIDNQTVISHPFHIHKIFFRILDIKDSTGLELDLEALGFNGPKDDILVQPGWKVRFLAAFDDFPNAIVPELSYMYHCHILTHEDAEGGGMMHQFVVTDAAVACTSVGIEDELAIAMLLYPNPAQNILYLESQSPQESKIKIIDTQGKRVKTQILDAFEGSTQIPIQGLAPGFYILRWENSQGTFSRKFLLN